MQRALHTQKLVAHPKDTPFMNAASCGFTKADLATMSAMYASPNYNYPLVEATRAHRLHGPPPPSQAARESLQWFDTVGTQPPPRPPWLPIVSKHRVFFADQALVFKDMPLRCVALTHASQKNHSGRSWRS